MKVKIQSSTTSTQWSYLVQGLPMCSNNVLYNNIAVYEVGAHPCGVEDRVCTVQVCNAHNVIANVTLFVYLWVIMCACMCVCVCVCVC